MKAMIMLVAAMNLGAGPVLASTSIGTTAVDHTVRSEGDRMTTALNLLEAKGYDSFTGFKTDGNHYVAMVTKGTHRFGVSVNPDSGRVTRQG